MRHPKASSTFLLPIIFLTVALLLFGCATPERQSAVPMDLQNSARIPGMPVVRYWADEVSEDLTSDTIEAAQREKAFLSSTRHVGPMPSAAFLAVSGGGDNGAFGAGLLAGWTKAGNRPQFKVVSGISTGALIAPFAFLGPAYDEKLRTLYTTISPKDIRKKRNIIGIFFKDAATDNKPLFNLLKKHITPEMLSAIAEEYKKGRLLLIGTTDLDAQRGVIWNIGKIAASGHPKALDLVRRILLASTAIPGVFPPMLLDVEAAGRNYQEMHVDGGATAQVFLYPPSFELKKRAGEIGISRERTLYIIRNARLDPYWSQVSPRTLSIMGRAISSLIQTQGIGDLYNMYLSAKRDGVDYNLACIPPTFDAPHPEQFDTAYMRQLCDFGYKLAINGFPWTKVPPGYVETKETQRAVPAGANGK